ncbi:hypothetical protein H8E88_25475 [candidate division KSB1 bacterium]|nr:hypothetical protein [candidate division KSB1 bacterium]
MEQDGSCGWTPQTWDVAGNEANFFIRDATNGSTLPFRIQPGAPSSNLCLKSDGKVGIGTWSPSFPLELETTSENATFIAQRTDGADAMVSAGGIETYFGSYSDHDLNLVVDASPKVKINYQGDIELLGTAGIAGIKFPDGTEQTTAATGGGGGGYWTQLDSPTRLYYNGGNVGIGTDDPITGLHIKTGWGNLAIDDPNYTDNNNLKWMLD